jgi:hypothetical protein
MKRGCFGDDPDAHAGSQGSEHLLRKREIVPQKESGDARCGEQAWLERPYRPNMRRPFPEDAGK